LSDVLLDLVDKPTAVAVKGVSGVFIRETPFDEVLAYADRIQAAGEDRARYLDAIARLLLVSVARWNWALLRRRPARIIYSSTCSR